MLALLSSLVVCVIFHGGTGEIDKKEMKKKKERKKEKRKEKGEKKIRKTRERETRR